MRSIFWRIEAEKPCKGKPYFFLCLCWKERYKFEKSIPFVAENAPEGCETIEKTLFTKKVVIDCGGQNGYDKEYDMGCRRLQIQWPNLKMRNTLPALKTIRDFTGGSVI